MLHLILIGKRPDSGAVKTRLARSVGDAAATRLYGAFLGDTLEVCRGADARLCISYTPASAAAYFSELAPEAVLLPQPDGDLGVRLAAAVETVFSLGAEGVVLVGSDLPQLELADLERALRAVRMGRAALGPSRDGGYWLLGLPRSVPAVFEGLDWSTDRVLGQTLDRLERAELEVVRLATRFDVDVGRDLERLRLLLEKLPPERCRRTREALAECPPLGHQQPLG